ncbi:Diphthamide biosynthesis protein 4 [Penicillium ucsense]|uniref:Diphthamide biosynthesis protein 4 n=1 Tax=Penicillium ucsense TaxID=2839758 RepID=A0A8J8WFJ5_9EURO|nr:Diphthamide biosynthesis protein 4 [Penicillium ucsense]KAF7732921.1 Diphthamide biosynthesis protein 4 [Penicillium ucsense]
MSSTPADHYQTLGLPFTTSSATLSKQEIKIAYHKALLKNHPDKASTIALPETTQLGTPTSRPSIPPTETPEKSPNPRIYTIDEITTAYKTLSDATLRAEYDRILRLDRAKLAEREKTGDVFHTGLEIADLEDLACDEDGVDARGACWYRGCRCGDERGFLVTEQELEKEADHGEIVVGCRGCSLWLKVLFAVEDDG